VKKNKMITRSSISLFGSTAIASFWTYFVLKSLKLSSGEDKLLIDLVFSLSFGLTVTSMFYTAFYRGMFLKNQHILSDPRTLVGDACLAQGIAVLLYLSGIVTSGVLYPTIIGLQSITTWLSFRVAIKGFKIQEYHSRIIPRIAAGSIIVFGLLAWPLRNFWPVDNILVAAAIWQASMHAIALIGISCWFSLGSKYRLDPQSILNSYRLRLDSENDEFSPWHTSILTAILQASVIAIGAAANKSYSPTYPFVGAITFQILFIPALIDAWHELAKVGGDHEALQSISRLTMQSARKLLLRHNQPKDSWAATIGIKTSVITIEHDIDNLLAGSIPANLFRIRNEETNNFVSRLTKNKSLAIQAQSEKIICTIDPELSVRPCVDALNLCATLYLDVGSLLERRMAGLISLLPIVNPGLSEAIKTQTALSALKQTKWFFYFDFNWVDQSIVSSAASSRYGIDQENLSPEVRVALINQMRQTHAVGNFVWIGKSAHERLLREAPNLASIMEAHSFRLNDGRELLMFSIRFEHLVPRLQRYYGLDDVRAEVVDFEPSLNAKRLLNILALQIANASSDVDILRIVEAVASYRWRGFKEKDQALNLLLSIFQKSKDDPKLVIKLAEKLNSAISRVGYPSQIMNQAQIYKLQQRDLIKLRATALDLNNPRFEEAWVTLANLDYTFFSAGDLKVIREILTTVVKRVEMVRQPVVHAKMIDCAVSLIQRSTPAGAQADLDLLMRIIDAMIHAKVGAESLAFAIDTISFINEVTGRKAQLSQKAVKFFDSLSAAQTKSSNAWFQSVSSRWQEYLSQQKENPHATKKVS